MKIIFATGNKGKLREASEILGPGFELVTPADFGITEDIPETGETLEENSLQKARYLFDRTGLACFADDTGLEVDGLGGAPGVHSARYASEVSEREGHPDPCTDHDFNANMDTLLRELGKRGPEASRKARFRSVITLILADGSVHSFDGRMEGRIAAEKTGTKGFGYDPIFIPDDFPQGTLGELGEEVKNAFSHRGKSLREMAAWLAENKKM